MKNKLALVLLTSIIVTGCAAQGSSVGDLAVGDDSAAIKAGRNRASAQLSRAELEQHRRQRQNVSEELALERENAPTNVIKSMVQWVLPQVRLA